MPVHVLLFSCIERFLEKFEVGRIACIFTHFFDEAVFEFIFGRSINFVEHTEAARPGLIGEAVGRQFIGDVVSVFILRGAVGCLFLDNNELTAFAGEYWYRKLRGKTLRIRIGIR